MESDFTDSPWIHPSHPALVLAPMEGVTDAPMRTLLTERGGFTFCVSEFLRISHQLLPAHTYRDHVPELAQGCVTPSGVPIQIQFLGGDEELMAQSALRGVQLGAKAIDINFGCPAPQVNRNDGGAALLKYPERIRRIVAAVRAAVPKEYPVSAKLRLGWENMDDIHVNAEQAALGGASWLTIHARTKVQGYAPPAHWRYIGEVRKRLYPLPIVANGDIWKMEDFLRCEEATGSKHFMIGRGALGDPALPHAIARHLGIPIRLPAQNRLETAPFGRDSRRWEPVLQRFSEISEPLSIKSEYTTRRIKQWLRFAYLSHALPWFEDVKRVQNLDEFFTRLREIHELPH